MRNNTKNKNKRHFRKSCLQCFSSEKVFVEHKETCFKINGKQNVKLRSGSIKFKNYFKQLTVSFKIYADFESLLGVRSSNKNNNISYIENIKNTFLAVLLIMFVLIKNLVSQLFFTKENM